MKTLFEISYDSHGWQLDYESLNEEGSLLYVHDRYISFKDLKGYMVDTQALLQATSEVILENQHMIDELHEAINDIDNESYTQDELKETLLQNASDLFNDIDDMGYYGYYDNNDIISDIAKKLGYKTGTVGYSQWAGFVARDDLSHEYIRAMYEGHDFFIIQEYEVLDDGTIGNSECVTSGYFASEDDILQAIIEETGISNKDIKVFIRDDLVYNNLLSSYQVKVTSNTTWHLKDIK